MNIDPDKYVVLDRETLIDKLADDSLTSMLGQAEEWIDENQVPLMTLPQIEKDIIDNSLKWFPEAFEKGIDLNLAVLGITGEAGECADILKKFLRGSIDRDEMYRQLAIETVDVLHYLCMVWVALQVDVSEMYQWKTAVNEKRFGQKEG